MTIYVVSYATAEFAGSQKLLNLTAKKFGLSTLPYDFEFIKKTEYYEKNKQIFFNKKGAGFWIWKPYIIKHSLDKINNDDFLIYVDSDFGFINNPEELTKECQDVGAGLYIINFLCKIWTKKDCFIIMGCNSEKYYNEYLTLGGINCWMKSNLSYQILDEWLKFAQNPKLSTRDPGIDNFPEFKRHSTDQSILTNLTTKYNVKRFMPPNRLIDGPNIKFYENLNLLRSKRIFRRNGAFNIENANIILKSEKIWQNPRQLFVGKPNLVSAVYDKNYLWRIDK
jgi:hypothetical protein